MGRHFAINFTLRAWRLSFLRLLCLGHLQEDLCP